jgi:site-specific DNA-methyltransferase (adenine-specific)
MGAEVAASMSGDLFSKFKEGASIAVQADAIALLQALPSESVDLVVTDPAYESLEKHRAVGTTTRLTKAWFPIFPNARFRGWLHELYRVMKPRTHAYVFCDEETRDLLIPLAREVGFWHWKSIPYIKCRSAAPDGPWDTAPDMAYSCLRSGTGYHWRATVEFVLFWEKATVPQRYPADAPRGQRRQLNNRSWPDVLFGTRVDGGYPTEKAPEVIERLILNSSNRLELVLDTFAGSGVVAKVARAAGRRFVIGDIAHEAILRWHADRLVEEVT